MVYINEIEMHRFLFYDGYVLNLIKYLIQAVKTLWLILQFLTILEIQKALIASKNFVFCQIIT